MATSTTDQSTSGSMDEADSPEAIAVYCGSKGGKSTLFEESVSSKCIFNLFEVHWQNCISGFIH